MTYSIVALDEATGEIGVAVATCWPAVGASVPWVEAGVGAVATQSFTNVDLGPEGLAMLRDGMAPSTALETLLATDRGADVRQVGVVDAAGRAAAHTGERCVAEAGHILAPGVSVQGNMLERPRVWESMLVAYADAAGDLAERLMAALRAAEALGGDIRGRRSAALVVAPGVSAGASDVRPWSRRFDLRVDASGRPLEELSRSLAVARAYEALDHGIEAVEAGDVARASEHLARAVELAPDDDQLGLWHALVGTGEVADMAALRAVIEREPRLAEFGRRFAAAGHGGPLVERLRELGARPR